MMRIRFWLRFVLGRESYLSGLWKMPGLGINAVIKINECQYKVIILVKNTNVCLCVCVYTLNTKVEIANQLWSHKQQRPEEVRELMKKVGFLFLPVFLILWPIFLPPMYS